MQLPFENNIYFFAEILVYNEKHLKVGLVITVNNSFATSS